MPLFVTDVEIRVGSPSLWVLEFKSQLGQAWAVDTENEDTLPLELLEDFEYKVEQDQWDVLQSILEDGLNVVIVQHYPGD